MAIKLKYDPTADRMRLWVDQPDGEDFIVWLRRNQCLPLLVQLSDLAIEKGIALQEVEPLRQPPQISRRNPVSDGVEPSVLDTVRVRAEGDQVIVHLVSGQKSIHLRLDGSGLKRFQEMLASQAERAWWDPTAAVQRLRAMSEVRAAIAKIQSRLAGPSET